MMTLPMRATPRRAAAPGPGRRLPPARQRGLATLVVVMVLFFIVAMVAAYTSRNLIFEQRTSANQYRSTIAFEAADAGVEWTLAMLNGGLVDAGCAPTGVLPGTSFQQRYLSVVVDLADPAKNGRILPAPGRPTDPLSPGDARLWPACSLDGGSWATTACRCPGAAQDAPAAANRPGFRVWLPELAALNSAANLPRPGLLPIRVNACTRTPEGINDCLDLDPQTPGGDALSTQYVVLALRPALASIPAAALTAQGALQVVPTGAQLTVVNAEATVNGLTVHAGGSLPAAALNARGLPGAPASTTWIDNDPRLAALATLPPGGDPLANNRMFVAQFGMLPAVYRNQPGLRGCPGVGAASCNAATLQALASRHPNRILWVDGDLTLDANLGTATEPVLLVVSNGTLRLGPNVRVTGLVYLAGVPAGGVSAPPQATLVAPGAGAASIDGALVAGGPLRIEHDGGTPTPPNGLTVSYNRAVLNLLRISYGSWVRLPGGWRDFRS